MRAILIALMLTACTPAKLVTRTETVEVPVLRYVPIPERLTAATPHPTTPTKRCVWAGAPALCVKELTDWIADYREALDNANTDKAAILELQKGAK